MYSDTKFANAKRNKGESYTFTVSRRMLTDEIRTLFCIQRDLGQSFATPSLEDKYLSIFLHNEILMKGRVVIAHIVETKLKK